MRLVLALILLLLAHEVLLAQGMSPFGRPTAPPPDFGPMGWIIAKQAEFYALLSRALSAVRTGSPGAVWSLISLSFLYGVFHAAGPGHGKAVISAYIVANGDTIRRGVALSLLSSLAQALVAIAAVGAMVLVFGATARSMGQVVRIMEIAGFSLIALIGARLLWSKGRAFARRFAAWRDNRPVAGLACDDNCVHLPPGRTGGAHRLMAGNAVAGAGCGGAALFRGDTCAGLCRLAAHFRCRHRRHLCHGGRHGDHGGPHRHPLIRLQADGRAPCLQPSGRADAGLQRRRGAGRTARRAVRAGPAFRLSRQ